ncbi:hypothetical protein MARCHEWKA_02280 [Brevundimonas phage vB_BpoS-Marchewka]|uniref:Uncharacterized protein n=1 Tax=Brevundimonas phage vB_BpoS-Marchewka TaxID=2948604 RepID=A0A9E7N473_9CAUD|nr:hypothetical protein MARCHEWKA_02280 [Brevundimonas phage vB_BpoS-Marchewka]UTC29187.1 hypothetical protein BAMBUS_01050 [Brevundimonas phage vB_BpoS-Bambus]
MIIDDDYGDMIEDALRLALAELPKIRKDARRHHVRERLTRAIEVFEDRREDHDMPRRREDEGRYG